MSRPKVSLSFINNGLLSVFLLVLSLGISFWVYLSTEKVLDYNIKQYFSQTTNLLNIIIENEKTSLDYMTFEAAEIIEDLPINENLLERKLESLSFLDRVDILYIQKNEKTLDFSNSLFNTKEIIANIKKDDLKNTFTIVSLNNKKYLLLIRSKDIIDKKTGRVQAKLYIGKIINDNLSFVNMIKKSASLNDVKIYINRELIVNTSNKAIINIKDFKDKKIIKENGKIYFKQKIIVDNKNSFDFVFSTNNSTSSLLKEDFKIIGILLFIFIIFVFIVLYMISDKYLIKPFSRLLKFAKKAKDNELVLYEESQILEFDNFAMDLKSIIDELRDLKEQYSRAIEGVQDGLWDLDLITGKSYYSNRYLLMLGYKNHLEVDIKDFWKKSVHKKDYRKTLKKLSKHLKGETSFYEDNYRFKCKNGSYKWLKVRGKVFFDIEGKPIRMTGFHTDIDHFIRLQEDNRKKEQMIYQQSKLAAMGEMIGNIAHQWRQPLNVISTIASSQIMQIELGLTKKEETVKDLNKVIDTVQYLSTIIDKFRNFFNPNKELEHFNIKDVIKDNIDIFETSYKSYGIELHTKLEPVEIQGYKFELMQVLINIINNAKDALRAKEIEDNKFIFMENYTKNDKVIIKVYDNAGGIKGSIKNKVYEPYFTTKHKSQGTGLGLYMSSEIIKKHFNGTLYNETIEYEYDNKKYKGEEFIIEIPININ